MTLTKDLNLPNFLYGTAWKEDRTAQLTELALRAGFRGIDTANQRRHYFEEGVGEGISAAIRAGIVVRSEIFLQTKFTYLRGQDQRVPYDPKAAYSVQVAQSLASSLEHLATDYVDRLGSSWAILERRLDRRRYRSLGGDGGRTRGWAVPRAGRQQRVSRATRTHGRHSRASSNVCAEPLLRCAGLGSGSEGMVRRTADRLPGIFAVDRKPRGDAASADQETIARLAEVSPAQIIFAFARGVGMLPLTGTSDPRHMEQDLDACKPVLPEEAIRQIEWLVD